MPLQAPGVHVVHIGGATAGASQLNEVVAAVQGDGHAAAVGGGGGERGEALGQAAVEAHLEGGVGRVGAVAKGQAVGPALAAVHVAPLQAVALQPVVAQSAHLGSARAGVVLADVGAGFTADGRVAAEPGVFGLVAHGFGAPPLEHVKTGGAGRQAHAEARGAGRQVAALHDVAHAHVSLCPVAQLLERYAQADGAVAGVVKGHGALSPVGREQVFHQYVRLAPSGHYVRLLPQRVLVDGQQFGVGEQAERFGAEGGEVAADEQRRAHDAPHGQVRAQLFGREASAYLEHVHVVVMARRGVGREVEVAADDGFDRLPAVLYVGGYAPGVRHVGHPRTRKGPPAHVQAHLVARHGAQGPADGGILRLFVQVEVLGVLRWVAAAKVHLDEVKAEFVEEVVRVGLLVPVEPDAHARIVVPVVAAGVAPGVGVGAGLQPEAVYVGHHRSQSLRKTGGMGVQAALGRAPVVGAVVNVDVAVAGLFQPVSGHGQCLPADEAVADVYAVGVPRAPPHHGTLGAGRQQKQGAQGRSSQ